MIDGSPDARGATAAGAARAAYAMAARRATVSARGGNLNVVRLPYGRTPTTGSVRSATADAATGVAYRPLKVLMRCMKPSTSARVTTSVGTMICFVSGMKDRSPRTACAMRLIA